MAEPVVDVVILTWNDGELLATAVRAIFIDNKTLADLWRRGDAVPRERHLEDD